MTDIEWRDSELEDAVKFLDCVNPHGWTAEQIKDFVTAEWEKGGRKSTFIGTGGWYVTIIEKQYEAEQPYIALVSIMSHTAFGGLQRWGHQLSEAKAARNVNLEWIKGLASDALDAMEVDAPKTALSRVKAILSYITDQA